MQPSVTQSNRAETIAALLTLVEVLWEWCGPGEWMTHPLLQKRWTDRYSLTQGETRELLEFLQEQERNMPKKRLDSSVWVTSAKVCEALEVTDDTLIKLRRSWTEGKHWIDIRRPQAARGSYRYNLAAIMELYQVPAEHR